MADLSFLKNIPLTELHTHLGFSVSPTMLWELAHEQGLKLPTKDYWEFEKLITIYDQKDYEEYLQLYDLTEKIQSSPEALFTAIQVAISGAYRKNNITKLELRFNPILRARGGERDLDHIIVFTLQGMERAMLKYPVKAGVILMMDRRFTEHENAAIVKKAIKYKYRGVVGVDLAGPIKRTENSQGFKPKQIAHLIKQAKEAGLGVTVHTGEATNVAEMWEVIEELKPNRIGHGIACVEDEKLMKHLTTKYIVLETCPTSNLHTKLVKNFDEMRHMYSTLKQHNVPFTINTDGPEMQRISLRGEFEKLLDNQILTVEDILKANKIATEASFIRYTGR
ncbi:TPA: adenosine deaminase [Patescibacteria group bacterium]|uniref:adenosine deaminase n=1 Tax=Candidatus Gottesmanbacteria bacterium GW2011_GWA1_43_11 TaxID=1618436 RepID=A0A0G1CF01_9BACT|nr:MAG: Adenosine/AMP deaminase family protein [Candidatus Gottesmanbacteria bacterium GW2011_GWA1_43_11]HCS78744.1 adenosine deaminase [Patescibacteria group bacterium]